jgi:hypothetical protein
MTGNSGDRDRWSAGGVAWNGFYPDGLHGVAGFGRDACCSACPATAASCIVNSRLADYPPPSDGQLCPGLDRQKCLPMMNPPKRGRMMAKAPEKTRKKVKAEAGKGLKNPKSLSSKQVQSLAGSACTAATAIPTAR